MWRTYEKLRKEIDSQMSGGEKFLNFRIALEEEHGNLTSEGNRDHVLNEKQARRLDK